jgi:adenylate cyclase
MPTEIGVLLGERYRLEAKIGRGGMGVVYRGHDTLLRRDVAVKVLSKANLGSQSRARLLREAQAAAQINHPNVVSVYDAGETELLTAEGTVPFVVMELVIGPSLHERRPEGLAQIVELACQVCAALDHAHAHGIVHRDLKPENVLLAPDGTAKLVDFGLARTVASRLTTDGAILGTIYYLAPEQAQGGEIDGRADLYALGVMLYEWTAGRLPFADGPPAVLIGQHLHAPVVPPREHNDEIPPALDALIVQLLSKRPEDRPASAAEVRQALSSLMAPSPPAGAAREGVHLPGFLQEAPGEGLAARPPFVAREGALAWLDGFLVQALGGQGRVTFVTGGPGRGKTALLDAFGRQAMDEHPELLVAGGTCNAYSGAGDAYLPFREVLAMLSGDVETRWAAGAIGHDHARRLWQALPAAVEALLDHGPHVMPVLVPREALLARAEAACPGAAWLGRLRERVERGRAGVIGLEQSHLFQQVSNVLHAMAEVHPLVLSLDDLQWVDRTSAGLLFHLGRRLAGSRILIVGAYRPEELAPGPDGERHPLDKLLAEFKRLFGDVWLDLADIDELEGRRFVDALLETEPNRLGEGFRQALAGQAGGHPLFTVELLRAMQERGNLVRDAEGHWIEGHVLDWELLPARVEGVIAERIEQLEGELREILRVASVEGEDFTAEVVGQVRSMETRELVRRLSGELQKEHRLVRAQGLRHLEARRLALYRFQHHLFQKYLYNSLDEAERAYLHEDVGTVLEALYGEQTDEVAVQLARHFLEAGATDKAAHYLGRAGEQAAERYANEEALAHLSQALEMMPDENHAERYRLLLCRNRVHELLGRWDEQRQELAKLEALAEELGPEQQAEAAARRARYAGQTDEYAVQMAMGQLATRLALEAGHTGLQAQGHLEWGTAQTWLGELSAAQTQYEKALELARAAGLQDVEAQALWRLARICRDRNEAPAARDFIEQALRLYQQTGDLLGEESALWELGIFVAGQGVFSYAQECFERSLSLARKIGGRRGEMYAYYGLGWVCELVGDYAEMQRYHEQALPIARAVLDRSAESSTLASLSEVARCRGDLVGGRAYAEQALHLAREIGAAHAVAGALIALGRIHEDLGEPATAQDSYKQALRLFREHGEPHYAMEVLAGQARTALSQGQSRQAQAHVAEILAYLDGGGTLSNYGMPFAVYATCCQVLEAAGDPRAREILDTAHTLLMEQADGIPDKAMRRSFLENVPWHREIVELAQERERRA